MDLNDCHLKLGGVYRFSLAILLFAIALAARLLILPVEADYAFITFYPLIVVVFYLCNIGPGLFVILLGAISSYYIVIPPFLAFSNNTGGLISVCIFLFSSSLIGFIVSRMQYYQHALNLSEQSAFAVPEDEVELYDRELYNRLTLISSRVPGVIYQYKLNPDGSSCFPYASDAIREIYRVTPEQVRKDASAVFEVLHPEDYDGIVASIQQSARSLEPWQYEYRVKFSDETVRWLYGNAIPALEADGAILWHGFITDITERKHIEIVLKLESEKNAAFLRNASDGITIMDISGRVLEVSDAFCNMLGYTREELIGMHVSQWDDGICKSELMAKVRAQFEQPIRAQFETRHRRKDGTIYDAEISGYPVQFNGQPVLFNSARDITERKLLEAKFTASSNEIQDLYDHAPCGYHSLDSDGIIIRINNTELQWLGYERDDVIGKKKISDFFTDTGKEQFWKTYPDFMKGGHVENLEFELVTKTGDLRVVSTSASAIRDDENNFVMTRSVLYDITELKKIQTQLKLLADEQQAMLDNELVGIIKSCDRRVVWINSAMTQIFGYKRGEIEGQLTRILYSDDAAFEAFGEVAYPILKTNATYRSQIEFVRKDKDKIWVDISGSRLAGSNNEFMWMMLDVTLLKKQQLEVERIAYHDILTGLPNRLLVVDRLVHALAQAERANQLLAVCYLDLDGFKPINDQYGHAAGDKLLIEIAHRIQKSIRVNDTVGRLGGDEFVLLLTDLKTADEYRLVLNRVIDEINSPYLIDSSTKVSVGASIGVTLFPNDSDDPDILLRHSDQAMYQAKKSGRNRICEYCGKD